MSKNANGLFGLSKRNSYVIIGVATFSLLWVIFSQWYIINEQSTFIEKRLQQLDKEAASIQFIKADPPIDSLFAPYYDSW